MFNAVVAVALIADNRDDGARVLGVIFGVTAVASLLAARQGIKLGDDGMRLQYTLRSRSVRWDELVCFRVAEVRNFFGERVTKPTALLRSGEVVPLPGVQGISFYGLRPRFPVMDRLEEEWRRLANSGYGRRPAPTPIPNAGNDGDEG